MGDVISGTKYTAVKSSEMILVEPRVCDHLIICQEALGHKSVGVKGYCLTVHFETGVTTYTLRLFLEPRYYMIHIL
jgi:hypothetical protein